MSQQNLSSSFLCCPVSLCLSLFCPPYSHPLLFPLSWCKQLMNWRWGRFTQRSWSLITTSRTERGGCSCNSSSSSRALQAPRYNIRNTCACTHTLTLENTYTLDAVMHVHTFTAWRYTLWLYACMHTHSLRPCICTHQLITDGCKTYGSLSEHTVIGYLLN